MMIIISLVDVLANDQLLFLIRVIDDYTATG